MIFTALFYNDKTDNAWLVRIPTIPGCHTYGATLKEARINIREALAVSLDDENRDVIAENAVIKEVIVEEDEYWT